MPEAKIEVTSREAILALGFVFLVVLSIALVQAGVITNPLTLGLMITLAIGLIFTGHFMARAGVIGKSTVPLWYVLTFGIVLLVYGGIEAGYIPVAFIFSRATVMEIVLLKRYMLDIGTTRDVL